MNLNHLPTSTQKVFNALSQFSSELRPFVLIGGTAIAIRKNHRLSEDLDFATTEQKLDTKSLQKIIENIKENGLNVVNITPNEAIEDFKNDGLDVNDYHQDWLIDGVKVTFFTYGKNDREREILHDNHEIYHGINVASVNSLIKSKCVAVMQRSKSRDLFDILFFIENGLMTVEDYLKISQQVFPYNTYENFLYNLLEKTINANDEGLAGVHVTDTVESIRDKIAVHVNQSQVNLVRQLSGTSKIKKPKTN